MHIQEKSTEIKTFTKDIFVDVTRDAIDEHALYDTSEQPECGAVLTFAGTVRNHHMGRKVIKLAYEAYEEMALKEIEKIAMECKGEWNDVRKIQVVHRFGEMGVCEPSIFISVSSPHRKEGFEALRFLIDRIKRDVPIWKKEFYEDGETDWLHPEEGCCAHHH